MEEDITKKTLTTVTRTLKSGEKICINLPVDITRALEIGPGMLIEVKIRNPKIMAPPSKKGNNFKNKSQ